MKTTPIRYLLFLTLILAFGPLAFGQSPNKCIIAAPLGICGPYDYALVTGHQPNNVNVQNDFWNYQNAAPSSSQTMYVTSPGKWYVDTNFPIGNTAIMSYPDSDAIYFVNSPTLDSYDYIYSSFAENMHQKRYTIAQAAYDIWLNSWSNEVMIWNDMSNRYPCGSQLAQEQFGGSNGVPVMTWDLYKCGSSELIWELDQSALGTGTPQDFGITSGSVDIYNMLKYLEDNSYLPEGTYLTQIEYGFEIASTGNHNERFDVTGFSVTASHGGQ